MVTPQVFLAYTRENLAKAEQLCEDLLDEGFSVWWDRDILPGQDWEHEINEAIERSSAFLLCFSREAEARTRSGIRPELMKAIEIYKKYEPGDIFLIPVRFSECEIPATKIDSVRTLKNLQYVDLFPPPERDEGIARLIASLEEAGISPSSEPLENLFRGDLTDKEYEKKKDEACEEAKKLVESDERREEIIKAARPIIRKQRVKLTKKQMEGLDKRFLVGPDELGRDSDAKYIRWVLRCYGLHPQIK